MREFALCVQIVASIFSPAGRVVVPVPKRAMTEAQQQEFRTLLQRHVTERLNH